MIAVDHRGATAVIRLERGRANTCDVEMLDRLAELLDSLSAGPGQAVVLTASGPIFSTGFDWPRALSEGARYTEQLALSATRALRTLFRFPGPVVAAVNGHAVSGGCLFVCACDHRIVVDGAVRLGFPRLRPDLPMVGVTLELARFAVPPHHLEEVLFRGDAYLPRDALARGLVDEIAPADELIDRALARADELSRAPSDSFRLTKQARREPIVRRMENGSTRLETEFPGACRSTEVPRHLRASMRETLRK